MELRHFRYFVAVAEAENVSRAALKLHVSQPGLSRQIHDLEEEIGFELFHRSAKSLRLTDAGKVFLEQARVVLQRAEEAVLAARAAAQGEAAEIQVGYAPSLAVQILPQALRVFQAKFPRVRVLLHDLSTEEMVTQLRSEKLQVGILVEPGRRMLGGLSFKELARYPMRVAVAPTHRLAQAKSLGLAEVAGEPVLGYSRKDYPEYHESVERLFASIRRKPKIVEEYDGVTGLIAAVESGRGLAIVPSLIACMVGTRLKLIPLTGAALEVVIGAAWKGGTAPVLVKEFIAAAVGVPAIDLGGG